MTGRSGNRAALCLALGLASFLLTMNTAPHRAWIPASASVVFAVLAMVRREHGWGFSPLIILLAMAFYLTSDHGVVTPGALPTDTVQLVSWDWKRVAGSSSKPVIAWQAELSNNSQDYIESVRLAMTTYDDKGQVVFADFSHATAIPPGETRQVSHLADAPGGEVKATVRVAEVTGHRF